MKWVDVSEVCSVWSVQNTGFSGFTVLLDPNTIISELSYQDKEVTSYSVKPVLAELGKNTQLI